MESVWSHRSGKKKIHLWKSKKLNVEKERKK